VFAVSTFDLTSLCTVCPSKSTSVTLPDAAAELNDGNEGALLLLSEVALCVLCVHVDACVCVCVCAYVYA
jgi:hypothetical protein